MNKISQKEMILEYLKENSNRFVPVYEPIGEKFMKGRGWVLFSHKSPARLTELFQEGKVDRKMVIGKSGSHYFTYQYIDNK